MFVPLPVRPLIVGCVPAAFSRQASGPSHLPTFSLEYVPRPGNICVRLQIARIAPELIAGPCDCITPAVRALTTRIGLIGLYHGDIDITEGEFKPFDELAV